MPCAWCRNVVSTRLRRIQLDNSFIGLFGFSRNAPVHMTRAECFARGMARGWPVLTLGSMRTSVEVTAGM
jgi:hypothetical protein